MHIRSIFATLLLATFALAQTLSQSVPKHALYGFTSPSVRPSQGGEAICVTGMVPVQARTSENINFNLQVPSNQSMVGQTFVSLVSTTIGLQTVNMAMGPMTTVTGTYEMSCTICFPRSGINGNIIEILTHGIGFDHTYWDLAPGNSYVDVAASKGHTTFSYDRLGVGRSAKPDPIQVIQGPLEVGIKHSLIQMIRNGYFANTRFRKVVAVGHSFGSAISTGLASRYPDDADMIVLTGFSNNQTGFPLFQAFGNFQIAAQNAPSRFYGLNNAFLVSGDSNNNQQLFLHEPNFNPALLRLAEATKGSVTLGELMTLATVGTPAMQYTGPIDIVIGQYDLPYCYGFCMDQVQQTKATLYPKASNASTSYVVPMVGHGINFHFNAASSFQQIQNFIASNM